MVHFFIYDGDQTKDFIKAIVGVPSNPVLCRLDKRLVGIVIHYASL